MARKTLNKLLYIWLATAALSWIMALSGCMTPQKAVNYLKGKKLLDDTCAANYPCITTDSVRTIIETDSAAYLDVIGILQGNLLDAWQTADSLVKAITAKDNITDTNCIKYTIAIRRLQVKIKRLEDSVRHLPPVEKKIIEKVKIRDTALEQTYKDKADKATSDLVQMTGKKEFWMKACLITWGILLIMVLIGYLIKKFTNRKISI